MDYGDFPGRPVVKTHMGSIPGWATKTLHAMWEKKRVMEGLWKPLRAKCSTISFLLKSRQVDFTVKRS